MPFSTQATLVAFVGDPERYPCHSMLKIGDKVTFNGEELKGKMCPDVMPKLAEMLNIVYTAGPRYVIPAHYSQFWFSVNSVFDPDYKKYDGNGWRPINEMYDEPEYHVRCLQDPNAFQWPIPDENKVLTDITIMCPDSRTGAIFKIEAFDLATAGQCLPYTRRAITMMDRVAKTGGAYPLDKVIDLYTEKELYDIYPPMSKVLIGMMAEEVSLLDFATVKDGMITITEKGKERVARYKTEIPAEDAEALGL
ncbi:MAG: hypothetical protein ACOX75_06625 [Lachnospiraceae bacterium]|jgi:hypothetical protein